jgi:hypothetical protein
MDDFRIGSLGFGESHAGQANDGSKKRSSPRNFDPQEEPTDQVLLSSSDDIEEKPVGYLPTPPADESA